MKHTADRLDFFEFHDAIIKDIELTSKAFTGTITRLNVHKYIPQNPDSWDMEIEQAKITFADFQVQELTVTEGATYPDEKPRKRIYTDEEAVERFRIEIKSLLQIYYLGIDENKLYHMDLCGDSPFFSIKFSFSSVKIEWDAYKDRAWYEQNFIIKKDLLFTTPYGEENKQVTHNFKQIDLDEDPVVSLYMQLNGKEYSVTAESTEDALLELVKKLPAGYGIKSCLSCRYGNFCPFGNRDNQIFCVDDFAPKDKIDLSEVTVFPEERAIRYRTLFEICPKYKPQSHDYFTYSAYLRVMDEKEF